MSRVREKTVKTNHLPVTLPTLPEGWAWTSVGCLAQSGEQPVLTGPFGSTLGREDFVAEGVPLLTIGCLRESGVTIDKAFFVSSEKAKQLERYRVRQGDLLFSRSASVGRAGLVTAAFDGSIINYHLMRLRLDEQVLDPCLFIYFVRSSEVVRAYLREVNHGATRDGINTSDLLGMPVLVPPHSLQRRIVQKIEELFSKLDAGVAALERVKANLKRYRAAVLKAAVEGKLTAEWRAQHPDTEPASKLLNRILKERRGKWEEAQLAKYTAAGKDPPKGWREKYKEPAGPGTDGLPKLPQGWCRATVEQLVHGIEAGKSFECLTRQAASDEWGVIKVSAMTWGRFLEEENKAIPLDKSVDPETEIRAGDLLLSRSNTVELVGATVLVENCRPKLLLSDKSMRLLPVDAVNRRWLHKAFSSRVARRQLSAMATGTSDSMRNVSQEKVVSVSLPLPPLAEQEQIVAEVERRLSIVDELEVQVAADLKRAGRLRQSVLKRAFAGRLVPQDASDEPAARLLEQIRGDSTPTGMAGPARGRQNGRKRKGGGS